MNIDIRRLQDRCNIASPAEKGHTFCYSEGLSHLLKLRPQRSISDEEKMGIRHGR